MTFNYILEDLNDSAEISEHSIDYMENVPSGSVRFITTENLLGEENKFDHKNQSLRTETIQIS